MKALTQIQREFLTARVTGTAQTSIPEMLPVYYAKYLSITTLPNIGLIDLENQWLRKIITDHAGTPQSKYNADLWKQAVSALGKVPSKYLPENKRIIYLNLI